MSLQGGKLAGGNPEGIRVKNDYYATNPLALKMLLEKEEFNFIRFLEPCVGGGHLADIIKAEKATYLDIEDRGYNNTIVVDYMEYNTEETYTSIITNPPYSLGKEFVEKSMELLEDGGKLAMFLKIQFMEGAKRIKMFEKYPPKYVYVFSKRMATWKEGNKTDENGKRWATTMTHAWYVWEKGFMGEPILRWLN